MREGRYRPPNGPLEVVLKSRWWRLRGTRRETGPAESRSIEVVLVGTPVIRAGGGNRVGGSLMSIIWEPCRWEDRVCIRSYDSGKQFGSLTQPKSENRLFTDRVRRLFGDKSACARSHSGALPDGFASL